MVQNDEPEFIVYQQKLWRVDFTGASAADDKARMNARAKDMFESGLRIMQLEYSQTVNDTYYEPGEHFSGGQAGSTDVGFTKHGATLARQARAAERDHQRPSRMELRASSCPTPYRRFRLLNAGRSRTTRSLARVAPVATGKSSVQHVAEGRVGLLG
jgi:hypothetical protein